MTSRRASPWTASRSATAPSPGQFGQRSAYKPVDRFVRDGHESQDSFTQRCAHEFVDHFMQRDSYGPSAA
eukprot:6978086-Alexandrium_andersonii.AAC.1